METHRHSSSRRSFLKRAGTLAPALAAGWGTGCSSSKRERPPNIVLFLADDLGYGDLSSYGCPDIRTPHIDSIAARGVRFTHSYANAPECSPTRTALLTGRYQQRVGGLECAIGVGDVGRYPEAVWLQKKGELGLPASELTMGRIFRHAGYDTACFGKWHLGYAEKFSANRHGFEEYFGILGGNADYFTHREASGLLTLRHNEEPVECEGYLTDLITAHSVEWLRKRPANKPFLLYVPYTAPHTPVQGPRDAGKRVDAANWNQGDRATYARMVECMDDGIGKVLAQLEAMGAAGNTLVLFFSDNGGYRLSRNDPFRGRKGTLWEGGIRVPGMARWPGVLPRGATSDQVSLTMDLLPTLLAAAAIAPPGGLAFDGVNLLDVWRGEREPFPRSVFWRYKRLQTRRKAVLHGRMKYIWNNGEEELYHLGRDEGEKQNLIEELPSVAEALRRKLADWEDEVKAPRLAGFTPAES